MPGPMEILLDPVSLAIIGLYAAIIVWESLWPARPLPRVKGWYLRCGVFFWIYFFLTAYLPLWVDPWLSQFQLLDLTHLGTLGGAAVALLVFEAGIYFWHRAIHSNDFLWRVFHQFHHSAERVDAWGTFYFNPTDMIGFSLAGSIALALLIGVTPQAVTVFLLVGTFLQLFQHANIKTPYWLGFVIQRPESHSLHHQRGVHYRNFSDLPVFDLLFGTFENGRGFQQEAGFYPGASNRIVDMLLCKDVSTPPKTSAP